MEASFIKIFFDGACHNQKNETSPMGIGVAVYIDREYQEDLSRAIYNGGIEIRGTNNIAEWLGCVEAMKIAADIRKSFPKSTIQVFSDSDLIASQYNGTYAINKLDFKKYYDEAWKYGSKANVLTVSWIPREKNKQADELSKIGLHGSNPESRHYEKYRNSRRVFDLL